MYPDSNGATVDEDFQADSESDVAEEYDSEHDSSGSSGDEDAGGANEDEEMEDAPDADAPPKKKTKTK